MVVGLLDHASFGSAVGVEQVQGRVDDRFRVVGLDHVGVVEDRLVLPAGGHQHGVRGAHPGDLDPPVGGHQLERQILGEDALGTLLGDRHRAAATLGQDHALDLRGHVLGGERLSGGEDERFPALPAGRVDVGDLDLLAVVFHGAAGDRQVGAAGLGKLQLGGKPSRDIVGCQQAVGRGPDTNLGLAPLGEQRQGLAALPGSLHVLHVGRQGHAEIPGRATVARPEALGLEALGGVHLEIQLLVEVVEQPPDPVRGVHELLAVPAGFHADRSLDHGDHVSQGRLHGLWL